MSDASDDANAPAVWQPGDDWLLQSTRVWDLRARRFRHPTRGNEGEFYYLDSRDWGLVLALTPENEVVLVRQFRWGAAELSWEIPGGIVERDEDPVAAGLRELREETGYVARSGRLLGRCRPNPAILNNHAHLVLAEDARLAEDTDWDEHEELEVRPVPYAQAERWIADGRITHALALNAFLYYRLQTGR